MEAELRDRWAALAGAGAAAEAALGHLLARYREPHRRYHGVTHLVRLLRDVDELLATEPVPDPDAVRFAAWYHDAVYDPAAPPGANEAASARLARAALGELAQPAHRVEAVVGLVLATATHQPATAAEAVLVDADLAVLAADPATYTAYATGVRREYAHLDDDTWRVGRDRVLRELLGRPRLFHARTWAARERVARANLTAELAGLRPRAPGGPEGTGSGAGTVAAVSGAPDTVVEALARLRARGYTADLEARPGGLRCTTCGADHDAELLVADHVDRFEGASDPGDEAIVLGVTCPVCGARGVVVSAYGPDADPEELAGIAMVAARYGTDPG